MHLNKLSDIHAVANEAGTTPSFLRGVVEAKERFFTAIDVRKRGGRGRRTVYEVHDSVRPIHRKIALWVRDSWDPPDCVHGFRKGRSIATHARAHLAQEWVITADILDFFPSIGPDDVREAFLFLGANDEVASLLTDLATFDEHLPPGTRCSPIVANVVARTLDAALQGLSANYGRYADDLAWSGANQLPTREQVEEVLSGKGFTLRPGSYFAVRKNRNQFVTGLLVNHAHGPHVPREVKRLLRQEVYFIEKYGLEDHCNRTGVHRADLHLMWLHGKLQQIASIEPSFARPLLASLPSMLEDDDGSMLDPDDFY